MISICRFAILVSILSLMTGAASAQREAAIEAKPQSRSLLLPQVNLDAGISRSEVSNANFGVRALLRRFCLERSVIGELHL